MAASDGFSPFAARFKRSTRAAKPSSDHRRENLVFAGEVLVHRWLRSIDRLGDPANGEMLEAFVLDDRPAHIDDVFARRSAKFLT